MTSDPRTPVSRRAVASFVLAVCLGPVGAIPAIWLGHRALMDITRHPGLRGRGFAIGGLVIGCIVALPTILIGAIWAWVRITGGA